MLQVLFIYLFMYHFTCKTKYCGNRDKIEHSQNNRNHATKSITIYSNSNK